MLYPTRGIVLRTVRYGDTSLIVTVFTEAFGVQSYMVKGARSPKSKSPRANLLQPSSQLDMMVYHRETGNLQYISEFRLDPIYGPLRTEMAKAAVGLFIAELLLRTLKQPEPHPDLYAFTSATFGFLDQEGSSAANIPLYYTLRLASLLGFGISGRFSEQTPYLDIQEGRFISSIPAHPQWLEKDQGMLLTQLIRAEDPTMASALDIGRPTRQKLLESCLEFLQWHVPDFSPMKSPAVLRDLMN